MAFTSLSPVAVINVKYSAAEERKMDISFFLFHHFILLEFFCLNFHIILSCPLHESRSQTPPIRLVLHPGRNYRLLQPDSRHCFVKISSRWNHIAVKILPCTIKYQYTLKYLIRTKIATCSNFFKIRKFLIKLYHPKNRTFLIGTSISKF